MSVTVIFGGTFNPFHIGHYAMLSALSELPQADRILLMPDRLPPHKQCDYLPPDADRIEMCRLIAGDFNNTELCLIEFERSGKSYTLDTVCQLQQQNPGVHYAMAIGGDMLSSLDTWYHWEELIKKIGFFVFRRADLSDFDVSVQKMRSLGAEITVIDREIPAISSTLIREKLQTGDADRFLPEKISDYIKKRNLYMPITVPDYKDYKDILQTRLSAKRYHHSLCVADEALRLAQKYGADPQKAYLAGLLHDITKNTIESEHFKLFNTFQVSLTEIERGSEKLWHAISGALYIRYLLNIDDDELLDAVRYHTTAKENMSLLAKVLYLADFTSADRDYDDVDVIRKLVDISMDEAMAYALRYTVMDLAERNLAIHPDTLSAYNEIMLKRRMTDGK